MPQFVIEDEGTIVVITPTTPAALAWLREHTVSEGWQWLGSSLCVDHRPAQALVAAIEREWSER